jgi:hypothetical protein
VIAPPPAGAEAGDRVFLDANVLFSAAYRVDSGLRALWSSGNAVTLLTTSYVIEETRRNLPDDAARGRLEDLLSSVTIVPDLLMGDLPIGITLPEKDRPILLSAMASGATHLITGDRTHFGPYFGRMIAGIMIQRPADYLRG